MRRPHADPSGLGARIRRPLRHRDLPEGRQAQPGRGRLAAARRRSGGRAGGRLRGLAQSRPAARCRPARCRRSTSRDAPSGSRARGPKVDRIACPWLIRRFVDPRAVFLFVAPSEVEAWPSASPPRRSTSRACSGAIAASACTFDVMVEEFGLATEPLNRLAAIVRGADTGRFEARAAGRRPARGLARAVAHVFRRSRAARSRHDALRRVLSLVPRRHRRDPHLAFGKTAHRVTHRGAAARPPHPLPGRFLLLVLAPRDAHRLDSPSASFADRAIVPDGNRGSLLGHRYAGHGRVRRAHTDFNLSNFPRCRQ